MHFKRVRKLSGMPLRFSVGVNRNREIRSQALFAGGGSTDKDLGLEHLKFIVPEDSHAEMSSRHLEKIIC